MVPPLSLSPTAPRFRRPSVCGFFLPSVQPNATRNAYCSARVNPATRDAGVVTQFEMGYQEFR